MLKDIFPYEYAESVYGIDYKKLYDMGYRGLIFDIDNTLTHHGDDATPEAEKLLGELTEMGFKVVLLSDNDKERCDRFVKNCGVPYVCDADKPHSAGFKRAIQTLRMSKKKTVCIGDQLFYDILGANRLGIATIMVHFITAPGETRIGKRRYAEFALLRLWKHTRLCGRLGDIFKED